MVRRSPSGARQQGASLIIALIIIVLITLTVASAFNLSSSNLKAVANVQYRSEAVASANRAIEQVVSGSFLAARGTTISQTIDIDKDGTAEYTAAVAIPTCPIRVRRVAQDAPSGYEVDPSGEKAGVYVADYQLTSTVSDTSITGASVTVVQGVRVPMEQADYAVYVPSSCGLTLVTSGND
jgi:Tfp pilus assembly protein PilX